MITISSFPLLVKGHSMPSQKPTKKFFLILAILIIVIVICVCGGILVIAALNSIQSPIPNTYPSSPPPTATPILFTPTPAPTRTPQQFTGRGQQTSPQFQLSSGLVTFHFTHDGQSNFAIWLLDDQGNQIDLLVNVIGPLDGSKALGIQKPGLYLLNIQADGNWTVEIK